MSTTPRTDAAVIASGFQAVPFGFQEFARSLEIELKEAEQIDNAANHYLSRAEKAESEVENLALLLRRVSRHLPQDNPLRKQVIDYLKDRKLTGKILRAEKEASK